MNFICNDRDTVTLTDKGKYRGFYFNGIYQFWGIPYAKAERFCPPEEIEPFEEIRDALNYGNVCPLMYPDKADGDIMSPHRVWFQDENCQNLNVWTPALSKESKLPVVVWFHGGGFFAGSAVEQYAYEGDQLAQYGNVVVVTVNHRLNVLGYLDLHGFGEKYERSCNAGNLDLIASLKWIRKNIEAFGGDPENVTIFGQSGGGGKVITLLQMPEADGLFHKALIMSGILGEVLSDQGLDLRPVIERTMKELDVADVDGLQKVPYPKLAQAYLKAYGELISDQGIPFFAPLPNQDYVGDPMKVGFTEHAKKIPVIIGSVYAEFFGSEYKAKRLSAEAMTEIIAGKYGQEKGKRLVKAFKAAYPEKTLADLFAADCGAFRYETKKWVAKRIEEGCTDTYLYMFALDFPVFDGTPAWHCSDIPYVFHNLKAAPVVNVEGVSENLCEQIAGAFIRFLYSGKPQNKLLPEWKCCEAGQERTMVFDRKTQLRINYDTEFMELCHELGINTCFL